MLTSLKKIISYCKLCSRFYAAIHTPEWLSVCVDAFAHAAVCVYVLQCVCIILDFAHYVKIQNNHWKFQSAE